jgi:CRP-like cAMP-binding protein
MLTSIRGTLAASVSFGVLLSATPALANEAEAVASVEAGETIIDHQENSKEIRLISHGTVRALVRMIEGREVILNDHGPGEYFGHLAAIDDGPRSASIVALSNCRICIMPKAVFQEIIEAVPEIAWRVMNHLTADIRRLSHRLSEFSFLKAKYRLYAEILRLSRPRTSVPSGLHSGHFKVILQTVFQAAEKLSLAT